MVDSPNSFAPFEPELLVATCSTEGEVISSNEAWQTLFGNRPDPWGQLSEEDRDLAERSMQEAATGSLVTNQIVGFPSPDRDAPLPLLLNFLPVLLPGDDGQNHVRAIIVSGEVLAEPSSWTVSQTQRHRLETLGRMTMGIAHDFNNLLSAILGYAELLKDLRPGNPVPESFPEHLGTIEKAAQDGAALVQKIQQYIRREKEKRFEPLDLPAIIQDSILLTRPYWYNEPRRQGIQIDVDLELADVPQILGMASDLREVFVNLILNAIQAMPEGGRLTLRTDYADDAVHVVVQDTGLGMSEAVRDRIFEPLFTTKGEHGTGMGLAVSYGIIQEHDGRIRVRSRLGEGAEFVLTFPPYEEEPQETPDIPPRAPHGSHAVHVLLVDDEPMVRSVLSKLLTLRGHQVESVPSGPAALELVESTTFDVIIVDQAMPEMSGRQLARHLRHRFPDLPIVLLTGDTEVGKPDNDIDVILGKPFKIDEVEDTILRLT